MSESPYQPSQRSGPANHRLNRFLFRKDLAKLALMFGSDKEGIHHYTQHYQRHFAPWRTKNLKVLEIGIGGYNDPKKGGESLRMWKAYFPNAQIYGIDITDKRCHEEARIKTFKGSQVDEAFLAQVVAEIGAIDIVIDDGSHLCSHVIDTFKFLFPRMKDQGIYVIEDTQTSYWEKVGGVDWGGSKQLDAPHTSMNFFKSLLDCLNHDEFTMEEYTPTYYDKNIIGMHMYHNLVFIDKGPNNEGSNIIGVHAGPYRTKA